MYLLGRTLYRQAQHSVCQTGSALTSDKDTQARTINTILKEGVVVRGQCRLLNPEWASPLVERSIRSSEKAILLSGVASFGTSQRVKKNYYQLIKANNLLMKLVESLLDLVSKFAQQMCAARFKFRDDPYCLRGFY